MPVNPKLTNGTLIQAGLVPAFYSHFTQTIDEVPEPGLEVHVWRFYLTNKDTGTESLTGTVTVKYDIASGECVYGERTN